MDPLNAFITWQFMLLSLGVAGVTFVMRTLVEYFFQQLINSRVWQDVFLPVFPPILGALMGWLIPNYPFPDGLVSLAGHIIFGLVAGMFSGLLYRALKAILNVRISTDPTSIIPPPISNYIPPPPPSPPSLMKGVVNRRKQP